MITLMVITILALTRKHIKRMKLKRAKEAKRDKELTKNDIDEIHRIEKEIEKSVGFETSN